MRQALALLARMILLTMRRLTMCRSQAHPVCVLLPIILAGVIGWTASASSSTAVGWVAPIAAASGEPEVVVAVIDTGVDYTHPDLRDSMWQNTTRLPGKHGFDFINDDDDPMDDYGHGTHCAGIIIQKARELGLQGKVRIMALKYMTEEGGGDIARAIRAYRYVIDARKQGVPVTVISNSWGSEENPPELEEVVAEAGRLGILSVCAAGNSATDLDIQKTFPSGYVSPYSIVVAASTPDAQLSSFSCYGKYTVQVAAPGTGIRSAYFQDAYLPGNNIQSQPLNWQLKKTNETYIDGVDSTRFSNVIEFPIREKPPDLAFVGLQYRIVAPACASGQCVVEFWRGKRWESAGSLSLKPANFENAKWFPIDSKATKVRLIGVDITADMILRIQSIGAGPSTGKYAIFSGTSMAAPAVAAEVIWLRERLPEASVEEIRARVIGGVLPVLPGLVVSDGIVDPARALHDPRPVLGSVTRQGKTIRLDGFFLGLPGEVRIGPNLVRWTSWTDRHIELDVGGSWNEFTPLTIRRADGAVATQLFVLPGESDSGWQKLSHLPQALSDAACAAVDGCIYLIGGSAADERTSLEVFRYNPDRNRWDKRCPLPASGHPEQFAYGLSAAVIDRNIYLLTFDTEQEVNRLFCYDPKADTWVAITSANGPPPRANARLVAFRGSLLLIGGIVKGDSFDDWQNKGLPIWQYNPDDRRWKEGPALLEERFDALAGQAGDQMIIAGGRRGDDGFVQTSELYDGITVRQGPDLPFSGLSAANAAAVPGATMTLMSDGHSFPQKGLVYYPGSSAWLTRDERLGYGQRLGAASAVLDDILYVFGGKLDNRMTADAFRLRLKAEEHLPTASTSVLAVTATPAPSSQPNLPTTTEQTITRTTPTTQETPPRMTPVMTTIQALSQSSTEPGAFATGIGTPVEVLTTGVMAFLIIGVIVIVLAAIIRRSHRP